MKMKKEEIEYAEKSRYTGKYKYSRTRRLSGKHPFCSNCRRNGRIWTARSEAGAIF